MKRILLYLFILFSLSACREETIDIDNPVGKLASVQLIFDNVVGTSDLVLDSQSYINDFEEEFTVKKFNYFISNIEFKLANGTYVKIPQDSSYFLIKEIDAFSHTANINLLPEGEYTGMRYILGVDSLRSRMPKEMQTGVLDQGGYAADMYWVWNQGYIFLKLEAYKYEPKGGSANIPYVYHIGGFGGYNTPTINNIRSIELSFPTSLHVHQTIKHKIKIKADLLKVITGPNPIKFEDNPTVMLTPFSAKVADNYVNMFSITAIE
jgi:hypothetical protein